MEGRRARILAKLNSRHPKANNSTVNVPKSSPESFLFLLKSEIDNIFRADPLDSAKIAEQLAIFSAKVAEKTTEMSAFDIRKAHEMLADFHAKLDAVRNVENSDNPFSFSCKNPQDRRATFVESAKKVTSKNSHTDELNDFVADKLGLNHLKDETTTLDGIFGKDPLLNDLTNCHVTLLQSPSTLHLTNCRLCTILVPPVHTSVFVENCHNCTLMVACQQLRIHSSDHMDVYLHITSKSTVIEQCENVRLAPYEPMAGVSKEHFRKIGLNIDINNWDKVVDFNWLSVEKPSPNWTILPINHRSRFSLPI